MPAMDNRLVSSLALGAFLIGCTPSDVPPSHGASLAVPPPPASVVDPVAAPPSTVTQPPVATAAPEATVLAAVKAAMSNDFQSYLALVHAEERANADMIHQIERYAWSRFAKQAKWYLDPAGNVVVDRSKPEGDSVMLYMHDFHTQGRLPPPMRLRLEHGQWRIVTNSL